MRFICSPAFGLRIKDRHSINSAKSARSIPSGHAQNAWPCPQRLQLRIPFDELLVQFLYRSFRRSQSFTARSAPATVAI